MGCHTKLVSPVYSAIKPIAADMGREVFCMGICGKVNATDEAGIWIQLADNRCTTCTFNYLWMHKYKSSLSKYIHLYASICMWVLRIHADGCRPTHTWAHTHTHTRTCGNSVSDTLVISINIQLPTLRYNDYRILFRFLRDYSELWIRHFSLWEIWHSLFLHEFKRDMLHESQLHLFPDIKRVSSFSTA